MNIIPMYGLIHPNFYQELVNQVGDEVLTQTFISYIQKRPQEWVTFAMFVISEFKENSEKEKSTFDDFLVYLEEQYSIYLKLKDFSLSDVTHISEKLAK